MYCYYLMWFRCGYCVGGKLGKLNNFGKDFCDVCNGDNIFCIDCVGVFNGKLKKDNCVSCLLESDVVFNIGCLVFGKVKFGSGEIGVVIVVMLKGVGY